MSKYFIERPIFAWVIAIVVMLGGVLAISSMSVNQYPSIAPPAIEVSITYPGASADTLQKTSVQVIEQKLRRQRIHYRYLRSGHRSGYCPGSGAEQSVAGRVAAAK